MNNNDYTLKVSLDNGETFQDAPNGVQVIYPQVFVRGEDEPGELHVKLTEEGMVKDVWVSREASLDHHLATHVQSLDIIIDAWWMMKTKRKRVNNEHDHR